MIGNAVPVNLAKYLALSIKSQIEDVEKKTEIIKEKKSKLETSLL